MISNDIILFGRHLIPVWWNDWQAIQVPYLQKRAIGVNPKSSQDYRWWMRSSFKIKRIGRFQSPTLMAVRSRHRQRNNSSIIWRCRFFSSFQNEINFIQKWKIEYERETGFMKLFVFFIQKRPTPTSGRGRAAESFWNVAFYPHDFWIALRLS